MKTFQALLFFVTYSLANSLPSDDGVYDIGVGIGDITGPVVDVVFFGYTSFTQSGQGLHLRLFSRTFIISDGNNRVVLVTAEINSISQVVRTEVINKLRAKYNGLYTEQNVCISATHTHSGPGGYHDYVVYEISSFGFVEDTFNAVVDGIVQSIVNAHNNIQKGYVYWNQGTLLQANYNRSPAAYLNNPQAERANYPYDVDKEMQLIKMTDLNNKPIGMMSWFPVHGTSMNKTNRLVSSDNKGYAAIKFEMSMNGGADIGTGPFVAAFAQANHGDTSPNILGPYCLNSGDTCDTPTNTCNGDSTQCVAMGPGRDMFESTRIIGERQLQKAMELFGNASEKLTGPVQFIHQHVDMTNIFLQKGTKTVNTCKAAMGVSFAAGTTDGPGTSFFEQGTTLNNPFWNYVQSFLQVPTTLQVACQYPKPILLDTGEIPVPYPWQPVIVPTQVLKVGNLMVLAVPAEFATMPGRRMKDAVTQVVTDTMAIPNLHVVVQSLSNVYSSYVTTFEEYQVQRYEGASTIYGPYTLDAYIQQYQFLARNLLLKQNITKGPDPPFLLNEVLGFSPGVIVDDPGLGKRFGQVVEDALSQYTISQNPVVSVTFISGYPRNSLAKIHTYLTVDKYDETSGKWTTIATDANWETRFYWNSTIPLLGQSKANIVWYVPSNQSKGTYRIQHFGYYKDLLQKMYAYSGMSRSFILN